MQKQVHSMVPRCIQSPKMKFDCQHKDGEGMVIAVEKPGEDFFQIKWNQHWIVLNVFVIIQVYKIIMENGKKSNEGNQDKNEKRKDVFLFSRSRPACIFFEPACWFFFSFFSWTIAGGKLSNFFETGCWAELREVPEFRIQLNADSYDGYDWLRF